MSTCACAISGDNAKNLSACEKSMCDLDIKNHQCRERKTKTIDLSWTAHLWESEVDGELTVKSEKDQFKEGSRSACWSQLAPPCESRLRLFPILCSGCHVGSLNMALVRVSSPQKRHTLQIRAVLPLPYPTTVLCSHHEGWGGSLKMCMSTEC